MAMEISQQASDGPAKMQACQAVKSRPDRCRETESDGQGNQHLLDTIERLHLQQAAMVERLQRLEAAKVVTLHQPEVLFWDPPSLQQAPGVRAELPSRHHPLPQLERRRQQLQEELSIIDREAHAARKQVARAQTQQAVLEREVKFLEDEISCASSQVQAAEEAAHRAHEECARLEEQKKAFCLELESLRRELQQANEARRQVDEKRLLLDQEVEGLEDEVTLQRRMLKRAIARCTAAETECARLFAEKEALAQELASSRENLASSQAEAHEQETSQAALSEEVGEWFEGASSTQRALRRCAAMAGGHSMLKDGSEVPAEDAALARRADESRREVSEARAAQLRAEQTLQEHRVALLEARAEATGLRTALAGVLGPHHSSSGDVEGGSRWQPASRGTRLPLVSDDAPGPEERRGHLSRSSEEAPEPPVPHGALRLAIERGDVAAALRLLHRRYVPGLNDLDDDGWSVLHQAISRRLPDVALAVVARADFNQVNAKAPGNWTVLHEAAYGGLLPVCRAILARPDFRELRARGQWSGKTARDWAAEQEHAEVVRMLAGAEGGPTRRPQST